MDFNNYYTQQAKQSIPVFKGSPYQRGFGIGNVFRRFFRWVIPIIKSNALPIVTNVGKEAIKTAVNIANDTIDGKDFKSSAKSQIKNSLNNMASQYGSGKKKKQTKKKLLYKQVKTTKKPSSTKISKKKTRRLDIFD